MKKPFALDMIKSWATLLKPRGCAMYWYCVLDVSSDLIRHAPHRFSYWPEGMTLRLT
jgi:hypothetical protein